MKLQRKTNGINRYKLPLKIGIEEKLTQTNVKVKLDFSIGNYDEDILSIWYEKNKLYEGFYMGKRKITWRFLRA